MTTRTRSRRLKRKQQEMVENGGVCIQRHRELAEDILSKSLVLSPERHRMLHPCCAERRVIGARPKQDGTISRESPSAQLQGLRPHVSSQKALRLRESGLLTESSSGRLRERDVKALPGRLAVPGSVSAIVDEHQSRGYCGQFSRDGSVFVSAFQVRRS